MEIKSTLIYGIKLGVKMSSIHSHCTGGLMVLMHNVNRERRSKNLPLLASYEEIMRETLKKYDKLNEFQYVSYGNLISDNDEDCDHFLCIGDMTLETSGTHQEVDLDNLNDMMKHYEEAGQRLKLLVMSLEIEDIIYTGELRWFEGWRVVDAN
jgi:hypothetical protein